MKIHELKILPKYFKQVNNKVKTFEIRKNDRGGFTVGDILVLKEFDSHREWEDVDGNKVNYSGKKVLRVITYVLQNVNGLDKDYVILGIEPIKEDIEVKWKGNMIKWGEIYHPTLEKYIMTYYPSGTPAYDSYTNPFIDEDGNIYYLKYDHDEGCWENDAYITLRDSEEYINLKDVVEY